ncbi:MAG: hypothetical protein ACOC2N_03835 [Spirochaetota bacterium]
MSGWLSLAITVLLLVIGYLILNRTITVRTSQQTALDEIKREVGAIITELNATSERNIELIEDRIATLERLLEQADRRIGALRRDLSSHGTTGTYSNLGSRAMTRRATEAGPPRDPGDGATVDGEPAKSRPGEPTPDHATARRSLRERVRGLYLQGLSLERIAAIVGKTVGEVELIVSLDEGTER